ETVGLGRNVRWCGGHQENRRGGGNTRSISPASHGRQLAAGGSKLHFIQKQAPPCNQSPAVQRICNENATKLALMANGGSMSDPMTAFPMEPVQGSERTGVAAFSAGPGASESTASRARASAPVGGQGRVSGLATVRAQDGHQSPSPSESISAVPMSV